MDETAIIISIAALIVGAIGTYYTYKAFKKNSSTTTIQSFGVGDAIGGDKVGGDKVAGNKTVYEKGK
ncbi:hypothetical protein [Sulfurimonas sp.]|uniref:hypothetical protein n=1 Tax=Sulfurimonas sp. TaxID=2022749 RepID=UPI00286E3482|nr:hypothetical protein [Sulfurimonas sp.]